MPEWSKVIGSKQDIRDRIMAEQPGHGQQVWSDLDRYPWEAPEHQQLEWLQQNPVITDFLLNRPSSAPQPRAQAAAPAPRQAPRAPAAPVVSAAPSSPWEEVRKPLTQMLNPKGYTAPQQPAAQGPAAPPSPWVSARNSLAPMQGPQEPWAPSLWRWLDRYYQQGR